METAEGIRVYIARRACETASQGGLAPSRRAQAKPAWCSVPGKIKERAERRMLAS